MKRILLVVVVMLFSTAVMAISADLQYPAGAASDKDAKVVAHYKARCAEFADENKLQGAQRDEFMAACMDTASKVWPVGVDAGGGGGGEG